MSGENGGAAWGRRAALRLAGFAAAAGGLAHEADAASDVENRDEVGEKVRKAGARLPGMGQPDVAYPAAFAGRWKATRVLAGIELPSGEGAVDPKLLEAAQKRKDKVEEFPVRFIRNGDRVVADREFNAEQEELSVNKQTVDAQWRASNPNVLTLTYPTGGVTEVKVTKRSVTMADDARGVEFSEYSRVAAADLGGVPEIGAKWVRGKFRLEEGDSKALGIVLEYVLPGDRPDPKYATMKLKYRISLSKDGD